MGHSFEMNKEIKQNKTMKIMIYCVLIINALVPFSGFVGVGLFFVLTLLLNQEKKLIKSLKHNKVLVLLLITMTISSLASELWYISIFATLFFILKVCFALASSVYIGEEDVEDILKVILILGIIIPLIGVVQVLIGNSMPSSWIDTRVYSITFRAYSTFRNPNILAVFLNLTIITGITTKIYKKNNKQLMKLSNWGIALGLVSLFLTYSRGGWVSLYIALAFATVFERKYFKYLIFILALFIGLDFLTEVKRMSLDKVAGDSSLHYRIEIWKSGIQILKENPILGIGKGTSWYYIHNYSEELKWYVFHAHNLYLQVLIDIGVVGFSICVTLIIRVWMDIKDSIFIKTGKGIINTLSVIFYISLLANGLIDSVATYPQITIFIWFLLGVNSKEVESISGSQITDGVYREELLQNNIVL